MITKAEAETRVARGAAHLDVVRPGWFNELDLGTLTLHTCGECVVGQIGKLLGLDWHGSVQALTRTGKVVLLSDCGFYIDSEGGELEAAYRPLQDAWVELIADRRLSTTVESQMANAAVGLSVLQPVASNART